MGSIRDRVAIVGMGCTKFGNNWDMSANDMMVDAAFEALEDSSIEIKDLEAAWFSSFFCPPGLTGQSLAKALKLPFLPVTRVENACASGTDALRNASYAVASGVYDIVLVLGVEKLKDNGLQGLPDAEMWLNMWGSHDNTYRCTTASGPAQFAQMATSYFSKYGIDSKEGKKMLAVIESTNHHNGTLTPKAQFQYEVSVEKIIKAPMIAAPLGLYDCCGISDGAAAAIVVPADKAKEFRSDPIYIKALQIAVGPCDGLMNPSYDYAHVEETTRAAAAAYREADIKNPREEVSIANVHDCFSITQLVTMEDLQFSPRGKAGEDVMSGFFSLDGGLPVNTDGGLKCFGHPIGASGIRMMYEMYKQLQGKADKRQVKDVSVGLTHNLGGIPGSASVSVGIVSKELG
ncbi:MAG: acetyl-CoA acetyltransferase [Desulfobacteraceae bacterium 4484_190.1]|nr:MAG: acetyl-CoA acetyltransferase [Desulfobacteraceae bacterium 4484_190.1]